MINRVTLVGRIGQEPALNTTNAKVAVAQISVATAKTFKDSISGEKRTKTQWHRVVAFRNIAEFISAYLHKGDTVFVEGSLEYREWTDKNGIQRTIAEIVADKVNLIHSTRNLVDPTTENSETKQSNEEGTQKEKEPNTNSDNFDYSKFIDKLPF